MPNYKISGSISEPCNISLMKDNTFLGYRTISSAGPYELIFTTTSGSGVSIVAENNAGRISGFGKVTPTSTASSANITSINPAGVDLMLGGIVSFGDGIDTAVVSLAQPVDWSRSVVFINLTGTKTGAYEAPYFIINSSTSISFIRKLSSVPASPAFHYRIVQYAPGALKSLQRGTVYNINSATLFTISSVNVNKSLIITAHQSNAETAGPCCFIASSTSISIKHVANCYVNWQVIEFN